MLLDPGGDLLGLVAATLLIAEPAAGDEVVDVPLGDVLLELGERR